VVGGLGFYFADTTTLGEWPTLSLHWKSTGVTYTNLGPTQ